MHFLKKCIHNEWIRKIDGWIITLKFCNVVYKIKNKTSHRDQLWKGGSQKLLGCLICKQS